MNKSYCMNCEGDNKIFFIHVPRTGGKSIRKWFKLGIHDEDFNLVRNSCTHRRAVTLPEKILDEFDSFAVIRDPWSRIVSLFHYYAGRKDMGPYKLLKRYNGSFNDFVLDLKNLPIAPTKGYEEQLNQSDIMLNANFHGCTYWLCDDSPEKNLLIKNPIRFSHYNEDLKVFSEKINFYIPIPLPVIDKDIWGSKGSTRGLKHGHYTEYYPSNGKLIQAVADYYNDDINVFGFDYEQ